MSNESVVGREQCPSCLDTSQDNLVNYSDGGKHCYACGYHVSGSGSAAPTTATTTTQVRTMLDLLPFFTTRNVSKAVLDKYSVKAFVDPETLESSVGFPLINASGSISCYHYRRLDTAAGKLTREFYYTKGSKVKCPLFGWQLVRATTKTLVVCEGETDTLALATHLSHRPEVTVVGAVGTGFGKKVAAWLARKALDFKVVLAFDNDKAGREASTDVVAFLRTNAPDLKLHKMVFESPDVGDALVAGENLEDALEAAPVATISCLKTSVEIADDTIAYINSLSDNTSIKLSFSPTLDEAVRLAPGKLVSIIGESGCGKSTLAEHFLLECLRPKQYATMVSAEMGAYEVALKLLSTMDGKGYHNHDFLCNATDEDKTYLHKAITSACKYFSLTDDFGGLDVGAIEEMVYEQIAAGQPPALVIIDHHLAIAENLDASTLEDTAKQMKALARNTNSCVVVICHCRKPPNNNGRTIWRPQKSDEYGSSGLGKYSDCMLGVAKDASKNQLLVETIKQERMGGKYADVVLTMHNWQLHEEETKTSALTTYDDDDTVDEDLY
jgi:Toprim-like/DnaB-like helicase C terminal domain